MWHEHFEYWWIFPLVMMALCFLMMLFRRGSSMCRFCSPRDYHRFPDHKDTLLDMLEKRYARGEIYRREYEEKKAELTRYQKNDKDQAR